MTKAAKKKSNKNKFIRIIGTACSNKAELKDFLKKLEVAKKKDHRLLGCSMGLFRF